MALFVRNNKTGMPKMAVCQEKASHILKMILLENDEAIEDLLDNKEELDAAINEEILTEAVAEELVEYKAPADKPSLMAAYVRAEEAGDEDFKKLVTAMSVVDELQRRLVEKYGKEAVKDAEEVAEKGSTSESETVAEACRKYLAKRK